MVVGWGPLSVVIGGGVWRGGCGDGGAWGPAAGCGLAGPAGCCSRPAVEGGPRVAGRWRGQSAWGACAAAGAGEGPTNHSSDYNNS